jgi:hypothetical protein
MEEFCIQRITAGVPNGEKHWIDAETAAEAVQKVCGFPVGESRRPLTDGFLVIPTDNPYLKLWFFPVERGQGSEWTRSR